MNDGQCILRYKYNSFFRAYSMYSWRNNTVSSAVSPYWLIIPRYLTEYTGGYLVVIYNSWLAWCGFTFSTIPLVISHCLSLCLTFLTWPIYTIIRCGGRLHDNVRYSAVAGTPKTFASPVLHPWEILDLLLKNARFLSPHIIGCLAT